MLSCYVLLSCSMNFSGYFGACTSVVTVCATRQWQVVAYQGEFWSLYISKLKPTLNNMLSRYPLNILWLFIICLCYHYFESHTFINASLLGGGALCSAMCVCMWQCNFLWYFYIIFIIFSLVLLYIFHYVVVLCCAVRCMLVCDSVLLYKVCGVWRRSLGVTTNVCIHEDAATSVTNSCDVTWCH